MDNFNLQGYIASGKLHSNSKTLTEAKKQGYDDREDESLGARKGAEKGKKQSMKDRRDDSYGKFGKRDAEKKGKNKINKENLAEKEDSKKGNESEQKRMEGAIKDDRDHIKNLKKDIEDNERKLARLKKDYKKDVIKEEEEEMSSSKMKVSDLKKKIKEDILAELSLSEAEEVDEDLDMTASPETLRKIIFQLLDDGHIQPETADDILNAISNSPSNNIYEADEEVDVDIDVEDEVEVDAEADDIEIERPGVKTTVDVGLSPEEEIVQDSLKAAMDAAQALGSDKLADQIGNTITFFTRQFVVGDNTD